MRFIATALFAALALPAAAGEIHGKVEVAKNPGGILVYVVKADGTFPAPAKPAAMDQTKMEFSPYVLPVLAGGTVEFKNSDQVNHNVFSPDAEGYNLGTWSPGQSKPHTFATPGVYTQLCSLHPEMIAYIVVAQNPYYALTKADGTFVIKGVPDGSYQVRVIGKPIRKKDQKKDFPVTVAGATELSLSF
jgi:plastocyanin